MTPDLDQAVAMRLSSVVADLKLADPTLMQEEVSDSPMRRRRGFVADDYSELSTLSLVRDDGALRWVYQPPLRSASSRRARRSAARTIGAEIVHEFSFNQIPPNRVISALEDLDKKLTPDQGLRRFNSVTGKFEPTSDLSVSGRVLLLIHGTFSKSDMFIDELNTFAAGRALIGTASAKYEAILAFDHPTLSVSPWINALDLESALIGISGPIDVVCHSRGGLVVGWWLRNAKRQVENVVFVGSPLEGTSLASPANLRAALQGLVSRVWKQPAHSHRLLFHSFRW